jgi:protein-S-isoprenylcysteine O-methyltransferase Ste14
MDIIKLGIFLLLSLFLLGFTLRRRHRHRFYRLGAFESLLGLILLNADVWFLDPFSGVQLLSWSLLASSLFLAIHSVRALYREGAPERDLEETTRLVQTGAYRLIRHPLYTSLLLLGSGAFLKNPSSIGLGLLLVLFIFTYGTGRAEEVDNLEKFGSVYQAYQAETRMFIPFLF